MPKVISVSKDSGHNFSKNTCPRVYLIQGEGVEGDAHCGKKVKHPYLAKKDPNQPNLRQVHLFFQEMIDDLNEQGFSLAPGSIGENITTSGIDLLSLPLHSVLKLGEDAEIKITGVRTPCIQLDRFQKGLTKAMASKDQQGQTNFKSGIMAVVIKSGEVKPGDKIASQFPPEPYQKLPAI